MPFAYMGLPGIVSKPARLNIASSTNTTPIVVTSSTNHLLTEGETVLIQDHQVNTAANGYWYAHKLSATTFSLYQLDGVTASVGNGVGGGYGTIQSLALMPVTTLGVDGVDPPSMTVFGVPEEDAQDKLNFLGVRLGAYRIQEALEGHVLDVSGGAAWSNPAITGVAWNENPDITTLIGANYAHVQTGDLVDFDFQTTFDGNTNSTNNLYAAIFYQIFTPGTTPTFASATRLPSIAFPGSYSPNILLRVSARLTVPTITGVQNVAMFVAFHSDISRSGTTSYYLRWDRSYSIRVLRAQ